MGIKGLLGKIGGIGMSWLGVNLIGGVGTVGGNGRGVGRNIGRNDMEKTWWMTGEGGVIVLEDGLIIMSNRDRINKHFWLIWEI